MAVVITDRAALKFDQLGQQKLGWPRIEIRAGGCNGFEKVFSWSENIEPDDITVSTAYGEIILDPVSHGMLENAIVDYVSDLSGSSFVISIPEAASTCGCGVSFSL